MPISPEQCRIRELEAEVATWRDVYSELLRLKMSAYSVTEQMCADLVNRVGELRLEALDRQIASPQIEGEVGVVTDPGDTQPDLLRIFDNIAKQLVWR